LLVTQASPVDHASVGAEADGAEGDTAHRDTRDGDTSSRRYPPADSGTTTGGRDFERQVDRRRLGDPAMTGPDPGENRRLGQVLGRGRRCAECRSGRRGACRCIRSRGATGRRERRRRGFAPSPRAPPRCRRSRLGRRPTGRSTPPRRRSPCSRT
jgi:hypothetical protein